MKFLFQVDNTSFSENTFRVKINLPPLSANDETYHICAKDGNDEPGNPKVFVLQGTDYWYQVKAHDKPIPLWGSIIIILACLTFSALFSGLNLGLMSLDKTDLKILSNIGEWNFNCDQCCSWAQKWHNFISYSCHTAQAISTFIFTHGS